MRQLLTGAGVRAIGNVKLRDCTYCKICSAVVVDTASHADFHAGIVALFQQVRRQSEKG